MSLFSLKYILRNKGKVNIVTLSVIFGILLIVLSNMIITSIDDNVHKAWAQPLEHFSVVVPLNDEFSLEEDDEIQSVYLDKVFITGVTGRISTHCFFVTPSTLEYICKVNNVDIIDGTMPQEGTNEIILSEDIAKNKGLKIGNSIGKEIIPDEGLIGSYRIVGLFKANGIFSVGDASYYKTKNPDTYAGYLIPRGKEELSEDGKSVDYTICSYESESEDIDKYGEMLNISLIVILSFVYIVIFFLTSFVIYIFTSQRKKEFGILMAVGFTKGMVMKKSLFEIGVLNFLGLIIGAVLSFSAGTLLNSCYFTPMGQSLSVIKGVYILPAVILTILNVIFSALIIITIVRKVDVIKIIEND